MWRVNEGGSMADRKKTVKKGGGAEASVRIAADLRQRVKVYAAQNSRHSSDVINEAVADFLRRKDAQ